MSSEVEQSIDALAKALDQTHELLLSVSPDRLKDPTPCTQWDVAGLIAHLVIDPRNFIAMSSGDQPDWSASPPLPDDWAGEFRLRADDLLHMWRQAGDSASAQSMDWQTAEFAVHTWDLVRALGAPMDLNPVVAERGLAFMSSALTPENRGEAFAPQVQIDADAEVYDQLAAVAGRKDPR